MFGFVSEELAKIRADAQDVDLYDSVIRYSTDGEEDVLQKKAQNFLEKISLYRSMMPYTSIRKIIEFILEDTGYYEYASVMPAGEQRAANLDMLVKKHRILNLQVTKVYFSLTDTLKNFINMTLISVRHLSQRME